MNPGIGELGAAGAAARRRLRLDHEHPVTGAGDRHCGDEAVRAGADDDGVVLGGRHHVGGYDPVAWCGEALRTHATVTG